MSDLDLAKLATNYTVDEHKFLIEIHHWLAEMYLVTMSYTPQGLAITFSNGQKFALTLEEFK